MSSRARSMRRPARTGSTGPIRYGPAPSPREHVDPLGLEEPSDEEAPDRGRAVSWTRTSFTHPSSPAPAANRPRSHLSASPVGHPPLRCDPSGRAILDSMERTYRCRPARGAVRLRAQRGAEPDGGRALEQHAAGRVHVRSAGSEPADRLNPAVVQAMAEIGIDISPGAAEAPADRRGRRDADVVITMGCGDACPVFPGIRYEDWELDDPAGKPLEEVRRIRDEIDRRVRHCSKSCRSGRKRRAERGERLRPDLEVDPLPAALTIQQARLVEHLQVVAHGRLREADRGRQVAAARLGARAGSDQAQEAKPGGVREGLEGGRERLGVLARSAGAANEGRTAGVELLDELHAGHIDRHRCVRQHIDRYRYDASRLGSGGDPMNDPCCPPDCCPPGCC